jgi:choline-sulfatase
MDEHVGKLLEAVGRLRLTENTLIAFSSDHGELLGEHDYYFMHGITVLQPVVSIPLILAGPGTKPGTRVTVPVSNADIMPTLLDLLGVSSRHAASQVQGRSLAPMLRGESDQARPLFCLVKRTREWCVRLGHLKYTKSDHPNTGRDGLFDLSADPQERQDISSARPDDAAGVAKHLEQFRSENPRVLEGSSTKAAPPLSDAEKQRLKALGYL